uniref:Ovule protein n=1 Tax=Parascaris equorum TaxID=6256 RepID=A0A914RKS2_PAREQ
MDQDLVFILMKADHFSTMFECHQRSYRMNAVIFVPSEFLLGLYVPVCLETIPYVSKRSSNEKSPILIL